MLKEGNTGSFTYLPTPPKSRCWQIDDSRFEEPLQDGEWVNQLARLLVPIAISCPEDKLVCSSSVGPSVDFGWQGFSTWVAVTGNKRLEKEFARAIEKLIPDQFIRNDRVDSSSHFLELLRIDGGYVWLPLDGATWQRVEPDGTAADNSNEESEDEFEPFDDGAGRRYSQPKRYRAAKADTKVGSIQASIEKLFKLPKGSVRLVNPDKSLSRSDQSVGALRKRWDA